MAEQGSVPETDKTRLIETLTATCSNVLARYLSDPDTAHSEAAAALKALIALEPECQAVFVMHRFLALDYGAIARRLGISETVVDSHLAQALLQMTVNIEACKSFERQHHAG